MWALVVPRVRPVIEAARLGAPVRRAQAGQRGHDGDAARIGHRARERLDLGRLRDEAEPVAQPLHQRAGDERAALERVRRRPRRFGLRIQRPGDRRQQPARRELRLRRRCSSAGTRPSRRCTSRRPARCSPGRTAPPADRRRCRRSGCRRAGRARPSCSASRPADGQTSGSIAGGTPNSAHSSGSKRRVRMSNSSVRDALVTSVACVSPPDSRQMRKLSTVPNAICPASARARSPATLSSIQRDLRRREVRIEHQARPRAHRRLVPGGLQLGADRRGAPVLPDDGVADRAAVGAVPQHAWSRAGW